MIWNIGRNLPIQ